MEQAVEKKVNIMGKLFNDLKQMKNAYDKKLREDGEAAVKEAFKEVFEKYPELYNIYWTQYTPYWNDGETCEFGVNGFDVSIGTEENHSDDSPYGLKKSADSRMRELGRAVESLEKELPGDVLESVFGDHVRIVATRQGFTITEFEHE